MQPGSIIANVQPTEARPPTGSGGVDAVDRALAILATFTANRERQTLAQLAASTGFYKSTILRLARSLEHAGYLSRDADGIFSLGSQPVRLAAVYKRGLRIEDRIRPVLRLLVSETGESASFFRTDGNQRLCLYREETPRAIRDHINEGDLLPMNLGAAGHVLTLAAREDHASAVKPIVSRGERDSETAAIAAPVFGPAGLIGALTLSGPLARFDEKRIAAMVKRLSEHSRNLTNAFGGRW